MHINKEYSDIAVFVPSKTKKGDLATKISFSILLFKLFTYSTKNTSGAIGSLILICVASRTNGTGIAPLIEVL